MEDMINRVIEVDEMERQLTATADDQRRRAEADVEKKRIEIRGEYLEHAQRRIELAREMEQKNADETLAEQVARHKAQLEQLEKYYAENKGGWVDTIVSRVIADEK